MMRSFNPRFMAPVRSSNKMVNLFENRVIPSIAITKSSVTSIPSSIPSRGFSTQGKAPSIAKTVTVPPRHSLALFPQPKFQGGNSKKISMARFPAAPKFLETGTVLFGLAGVGLGLLLLSSQQEEAEAKEASLDYNKIRKDIVNLLESDPKYDDGSFAPLLVRLAWHASGTYDNITKTGGSNGAGMRYDKEGGDSANAGLAKARQLLEPIKKKYPDLTYADLWTLASVVAIKEIGGPDVKWRPGRSDFADDNKVAPRGRLPNAALGADHIRAVFNRMDFNDQEIVALIGAHVLGRCHRDRSGYDGPWTKSPTMFSNEYFRELVENKWEVRKWDGPEQYSDPSGELMMLPSDIALLKDPKFGKWVRAFAKDEDLFFKEFAKAYAKLMELGVPF